MSEDFSAAEPLLAEYADIEAEMAGPAAADPGAMRRLGRRYAELGRVVAAYRAWQAASADLADARELAAEDEDFAAEVPALEAAEAAAGEHLREVLVPRDPDDSRDVIIEVKAGEGGEESALFASDLARMYSRYAERQGWAVEVLDATDSDLGGYKDVRLAIKARGPVEPQDGVWAHLKYEGGVHRVQRVPVTESQGRIHTSAAGVLVMPEVDDPGELQIDAGIVVSMQNEKSQLQNKEAAMRVLRARLLAERAAAAAAEAAQARRSQVRTVDRSERIRTYNFPENRIADHRTGFKAYNLDAVLDGDLGPVIASAIAMDEAERLSQVGEGSGS